MQILKKEFNKLLDSNFISIKDLELSRDYSTISEIKLLITTDNIPNNEIEFCNKLIYSYNNIKELLREYNYTSQNVRFKFTDKNPFSEETSTFYQESGYISDVGSGHWIYLNPTPLKISK